MRIKICLAACTLAAATTPVAQAEPPPNFPDLTGFAVVTDSHQAQYQGGTQLVVKFATPDGLRCSIGVLGGVGPATRCYGPVPGMDAIPVVVDPTAQSDCAFGVAQLHSASPGLINNRRGTCPTDLNDARPIGVGEQVSWGSTTCGVAPGGVTACIDRTDGGHGFVLQPSGSWTF